jgi:hypothetical protein
MSQSSSQRRAARRYQAGGRSDPADGLPSGTAKAEVLTIGAIQDAGGALQRSISGKIGSFRSAAGDL